MKILLILKTHTSLTGAGTYESILSKELAKRHQVKVYEGPKDLSTDFDIAHCSDLKHLPLWLARKLRCPLVVDAHDYYWINYYHFFCLDFPVRFLLQKYRKIKYHFLFKHIDGIILHGRFMFDIFDHPHKYLNFYFGLDYAVTKKKSWEERENLILFVGGDFFRKGLPRLLRALPMVLHQIPTARVKVIGIDHWYARWLARFMSHGLPVEFAYGLPQAEVYKEYARARVLVLPSEIEALSLVSAEATMSGVPPVLADVGGMPEIVENGKTGFVFPLKNTEILAERIVSCLRDKELSERFVSSGQSFFGRFTIKGMMDRLDEIYSEVLSENK